jgi:hypothetical protein
MKEVHNIIIPYLVRFVWTGTEAQQAWGTKIVDARDYLLKRFPSLLVESGIAKFAPTTDLELSNRILGQAVVTNHYPVRWSTDEKAIANYPHLSKLIGTIGNYDIEFDSSNRWDLLRDLYQLALAPECCKKAYFESPYKDPYHHLYENERGKVKKMKSGVMNSLHAPLGLFISPIVPCSLNCEHAHNKALEIEAAVKSDNAEVHNTLKVVGEMPFRIDSYRGMACVDTPMFKGVFATDAYKEKSILDVRPSNTEVFTYSDEWVAKGARFPFKGQFSELFGG